MVAARSTPSLLALGSTVGFGAFLALLSTTVVTVGLDRLSTELGASLDQIQWVTTAYLLALAVAIPVTGWGVDRFGGRTLWLAALIGYLAGSALATAADSVPVLVTARAAQGFGAGMLEPIMLAMLTTAAGPSRVTRVLSLIQIPITLAPACGPFVGGAIVDHLSWRWLFGLNLPLGLLALVFSLRVLPRTRQKADPGRPDVSGFLLLSPGLAVLLYGLARTGDGLAIDSVPVVVPTVAGLALLVGYAVHALRRGSSALIDIRLFANTRFAASGLIACLFGASVYGLMFLLPLFAQRANGADALLAGLRLAPQGIGTILVLPLVAALSSRFGARTTVTAGMLLAAVGTVPYALPALHSDQALLSVSLLLRGIGLGMVLGPALASAYTTIPPRAAARASSALVTLIQLGGAAGTALLAVVLQRQPAGVGAFGTTFRWVLGICVLGALLALHLPNRTVNREEAHV